MKNKYNIVITQSEVSFLLKNKTLNESIFSKDLLIKIKKITKKIGLSLKKIKSILIFVYKMTKKIPTLTLLASGFLLVGCGSSNLKKDT